MKLRTVLVAMMAAIAPLSCARADGFIFGFTGSSIVGPVGTQQLIINGSITLNATATGWYNNDGLHDAANPNYIASTGSENDFFVFNLSSLTGITITSATLSLFNPPNSFSGTGSNVYSNFDVTTPISTLEASHNDGGLIFDDLGSGTLYGSVPVSAADNNTNVNIALDADALAALTAAEGAQFAIGGCLSSPATACALSSVPGPIAGAGLPGLIFASGGALAWWRRKRKAQQISLTQKSKT